MTKDKDPRDAALLAMERLTRLLVEKSDECAKAWDAASQAQLHSSWLTDRLKKHEGSHDRDTL